MKLSIILVEIDVENAKNIVVNGKLWYYFSVQLNSKGIIL